MNMNRSEVIENSIRMLIGTAQTLELGEKGIAALVKDNGYLDAPVYEIITEILDTLHECVESVAYEIRDQQVKKLYDFAGSSSPSDCPLCNTEFLQLNRDKFVCVNCGFVLEL